MSKPTDTNQDSRESQFRIALNQLVDDDNMPEVLALIRTEKLKLLNEQLDRLEGQMVQHGEDGLIISERAFEKEREKLKEAEL